MGKVHTNMNKILSGLLFTLLLFFPVNAAAREMKSDVPYLPMKQEVAAEMVRKANVGKDDLLYDLGCGDGLIVVTAAKKYGARGVGIDINPLRIE